MFCLSRFLDRNSKEKSTFFFFFPFLLAVVLGVAIVIAYTLLILWRWVTKILLSRNLVKHSSAFGIDTTGFVLLFSFFIHSSAKCLTLCKYYLPVRIFVHLCISISSSKCLRCVSSWRLYFTLYSIFTRLSFLCVLKLNVLHFSRIRAWKLLRPSP